MSLIMGGCGKKVQDIEKEHAMTGNGQAGSDMEYADGYEFTTFNLRIDVGGQRDVIAEYHVKKNKITAEYNNRAKKIKLKGDEAMEELHKIFTDIKLTKELPQQEVIDNVLKAVDVDNFSKFKLKITYNDGTELEFEEAL